MNITLYIKHGCSLCETAKGKLSEQGLDYNVIEAENGAEEMAQFYYHAEKGLFPLILIDEKMHEGKDAIIEINRLKKERMTNVY